jgi:hypothetical protein
MYGGSQLVPPSLSDPHGLGDPHGVERDLRERHAAELKTAKPRGRHAGHRSHRPFGWLRAGHERQHG